MNWPCQKRLVTIVICILECLFFSGLLNGWITLQQILKEDKYYLDSCNSSLVSAHHKQRAIETSNILDIDNGLNNPFTTVHENGVRYKCIWKRVLKIVTIKEYEKYHKSISTPNSPDENDVDIRHIKELADNKTSNLFCNEQDDNLEFIMSLVIIIRNLLMLPLGIFLDKYGTSRTRVIAMTCNVFGALTMLFASDVYPWLIFPALLMLGISGMLVLLTDLQVSNLFGFRRLIVMSTFVGSYFSGGITVIFMKLSRASGVSVQTSFMFITIGIVPVLISTISLLPRSRIPWPLPANYGKGKSVESDFKNKSWNRRISVGPKKKGEMADFLLVVKTKLYSCMVVWFALMSLKSLVFDLNIDLQLRNLGITDTPKYISIFAMCMLFSLPLAPFIGIVMDWHRTSVPAQQINIQQMRNILHAILINYAITLASSVASLFPNIYVQVTSYIFVAIEKVTLYSTMFAFLTHVHFPAEHFGKLVGTTIFISGIIMTLQYPLKSLIFHGLSQNIFYIHVILLVLMLIAACHPLCVWYHCKTGQIQNLSAYQEPEKFETTVLIMENVRKDKSDKDEDITQEQTTKAICLQITDL